MDVADRDEIIQRIKEALTRKHWNLSDLASELNKSRGWMSQIMNGEIELRVSTLVDIARVLGVEPASLIPATTGNAKTSFEEYIRQLCRDEIEREKIKTRQ